MTTLTFTDVLRCEVARMQALRPERLGEIARAHAMIIEGHVVALDAANGKVLARNGHAWHAVNGTCNCTAGSFGKPCRHLSAWKLYRHVQQQYEGMQTPAPAPTPTPAPSVGAGIDPRFLTTVNGKPFIRFDGLLSLAHERGLVDLETTVVSVSAELAVCQCIARFRDGRTFIDIGDASPSNVKTHLRPHFIRIAATRASARALRRALNIDAVAVEELGDDATE